MSAAEHLAQYGVSFQQARDFIHSNLNSPQVIYNVAAQYGVTFDMLGELYADNVTGSTVKSFFESLDLGLDTSNDAPTVTASIPTPIEMPDLSIDGLLNLSDEVLITGYDWDSLISDYQEALSNIDWSAWNTTLESTLADFDWEAWASELQAYADILANDDSWISDLEDLFGNSNLEDLFDDDMAWPDITGEDLNSTLDDINWDDYAGYLAQFGITEEQFSTLLAQAFDAVDWTAIMDQIANFDWEGYADMLTSSLSELEGLYSNIDFSNQAALIGLVDTPSSELIG